MCAGASKFVSPRSWSSRLPAIPSVLQVHVPVRAALLNAVCAQIVASAGRDVELLVQLHCRLCGSCSFVPCLPVPVCRSMAPHTLDCSSHCRGLSLCNIGDCVKLISMKNIGFLAHFVHATGSLVVGCHFPFVNSHIYKLYVCDCHCASSVYVYVPHVFNCTCPFNFSSMVPPALPCIATFACPRLPFPILPAITAFLCFRWMVCHLQFGCASFCSPALGYTLNPHPIIVCMYFHSILQKPSVFQFSLRAVIAF